MQTLKKIFFRIQLKCLQNSNSRGNDGAKMLADDPKYSTEASRIFLRSPGKRNVLLVGVIKIVCANQCFSKTHRQTQQMHFCMISFELRKYENWCGVKKTRILSHHLFQPECHKQILAIRRVIFPCSRIILRAEKALRFTCLPIYRPFGIHHSYVENDFSFIVLSAQTSLYNLQRAVNP